MNVPMQVLLLLVGVILSALVALLLSQVSGLRSDMRTYVEEQKEQRKDHQGLSDRVLVLERDHKNMTCSFARERGA
jgi:hypothetical protein